jgi:hypothetical protein
MMGYFRQFFARGNLRSRDVKIFLGVFRQIEWYLNRYSVQNDATPPPPLKAGGTTRPPAGLPPRG